MKIFVLESLRVGDPKTGEFIHNFLDSKGFDNEYFEFRSKKELLNLLEKIKLSSSSNGIQPFVHFDCHGNNDGIGVVKVDSSEELITWDEIGDAFRDIYAASGKKSVICMSSCKGFNIIKLVAQLKPCPYDHVCGSFESISFSDSFYGYKKFYDLVISGKSYYDAAVEVHNDPQFIDLKFLGINSFTLFKMTVDGYIKLECTNERLAQKKRGM